MFKLKKENVVKLTNSAEQKDKLIEQGYQLVSDEKTELVAGQSATNSDNKVIDSDKGGNDDKTGKQSTRRGRSIKKDR